MEAILRIYSKITHRKGRSSESVKSSTNNYLIEPFYAGIAGFATFLFFLFLIETLMHFSGISHKFVFGTKEVSIASIGFALQFISRILKNFN